MRRFVIGTLALFATLFFAFFIEGGNLGDFILPSPLLIVLGVPVCSVLAVWSLKDWGRAWKDALAARAAGSASPSAPASSRLWAFFEKACYVAGIVGFILGLNVIFKDQFLRGDAAGFLRSLSVDCITPILAILLAMVARILRARVEERG